MTKRWTYIIAVVSVAATVANIYKVPGCFGGWLLTNTAWCIHNWRKGERAQAARDGVYIVLAAWGLLKWLHLI